MLGLTDAKNQVPFGGTERPLTHHGNDTEQPIGYSLNLTFDLVFSGRGEFKME
jgi:hypothetical protein